MELNISNQNRRHSILCTWCVNALEICRDSSQIKPCTGSHKKLELLKNPTKFEEIQEKNVLTEIEPLQLAF